MHSGFAIALSWPETYCKRAGAWYDWPLHFLKVSKEGYYKVGHAAIVLVDKSTQKCEYYDFGRYHAPPGFGRVRSAETDHDLIIKTEARLSTCESYIENWEEILLELHQNESTHGNGPTHSAITPINYNQAKSSIVEFQTKEFLPYGPFVWNGTNCSRFVRTVLLKGSSFRFNPRLMIPLTISPTPQENIRALQNAKVIAL